MSFYTSNTSMTLLGMNRRHRVCKAIDDVSPNPMSF